MRETAGLTDPYEVEVKWLGLPCSNPRSSNKGQIRIGSRKDGQAPKIAKLPYKWLKYGLW